MAIVPKKFTANATHTTAMARSMGQISSAYSFDWVRPSGRVIAADTMMSCHPQKWKRDRKSLHIRVLSSRCNE